MRKLLLIMLGLLLGAAPAGAADKLTVLLDWFVNPDHGPLVIARQQGFFKRAGLEVELIAPADPNDPPKLVAAKQADIGVSYQPQLHFYANEALPLTRIGTLIATPLNCLLVREAGPIKAIADLKGRKVGYSVGGFEDALLGTILQGAGLAPGSVELVNVNFALSPAVISGQVDAVIGAYRNFELTQMAIQGVPGRCFFVEELGVPAYDELIYIAHQDAVARPELGRFLDAVEAATLWLLNHPDEAWDSFRSYQPELDDRLNAVAWVDTLRRFEQTPRALDTGRYARFANYLHGLGLIKAPPPVATYAVEIAIP